MKKKNQKLDNLKPDSKHPILKLFFDIARLKSLYRQGWLRKGVSEQEAESVAEHSFSVAMLVMVIAEEYFPEMDLNKVMKMSVLHDIAESRAGDYTPHDDISIDEKRKRQKESAYEVLQQFPNPEKYIKLWQEFFDQETKEAKLVRQVDKLEMALQADLYKRLGYEDLDEFYDYCNDLIDMPEVKGIISMLRKT